MGNEALPMIQVETVRGGKTIIENGGQQQSTSLPPIEWNEETCVRQLPTTAYGKIQFANDEFNSKLAKVTPFVSTLIQVMCTFDAVHTPKRYNAHGEGYGNTHNSVAYR